MGKMTVQTNTGGKWRRLAIGGLSLVVAASSVPLGPAVSVLAASSAIQNEAELASAGTVSTPLLITEITADTHQADGTTASGTDAFEYFEITNVADFAVSLDSYQVQYVNGSTITDWNLPEGLTLAAGETLVVWVRNEVSDGLENDAFLSYYGISGEGMQLVKTANTVGGFANGSQRSLRIAVKATGQVITQATYNDGEQTAQTKKGMTFGYTDGQVQQPTLSYDGDPTPGTAAAEQLPDGTYQVAEQADATVDVTAETQVEAGNSYSISATTNLTGLVLEAYAQVQAAGQTQRFDLAYEDGSFTASAPASLLEGLTEFTFQVYMTDGVNTAVSQEMTVAVTQDTPDTGEEAELAAPLVITEIVPNTDNVSGSDAYEYFELYNAGDQEISLDDYTFQYDNGSTVREWALTQEGLTLGAGESLVVWVRNTANLEAGYTAADFNSYYGTALEEGVNLAQVESDGFSNSGSRSISVTSKTGLTFYTVTYTASDSQDGSLGVKEAIAFDYNGSQVSVRYDRETTPGTLDAEQAIEGQYVFPETVTEPSVTGSASSSVGEGETWTVSVGENNLTGQILRAELRIYVSGSESPYTVLDMNYQEDTLQASLTHDQVREAESFQYEIWVTDGVNEAVSSRETVTVGESGTQVDASLAPALVITELLPDSSNVNSADAYEFIELYNNSNQTINLKDYKLYYNYPDNGEDSDVVWWETSEDRELAPGETLVFWVKNGSNDELTLADFNAKFGTSLTEEQVVEISCGGMSNSGARGLKIASNVKDVLDYVTYNMDGADNTTADQSIVFQNRYVDGAFSSVLAEDAATPTPGTVTDAERPTYQAQLPDTAAAPTLTDQTAASYSQEDESFTFSLEAVSEDTTVKTVRLYLRDNNTDEYEVYNLLREEGDVFSRTLEAVDLYGKAYYEYYFEVSDGYQTVSTEVKQVTNLDAPAEGDSLNVSDGQYLSGIQSIIGTGGNLTIDGTDVSGQTVASINGDAQIVFETSQTDVFFKNAVAIGQDVLGVFNEGTYDTWETYSYLVDEHYFDSETKEITIAFHAGNKANNLEHNIENNDDFVLRNIRLILPDGVTLRPVKYEAVQGLGAVEHTEENWNPDQPYDMGQVSSETEISMGDGTSKVEILYVTFQLTEENFNALRYDLDTTTLSDGEHTIVSGEASAQVLVDNTAPEITASLEEGGSYRQAEITAQATDNLSESVELTALLDGTAIQLPYTLEAGALEPGTHTLSLTAVDEAGNTAEKTIRFTVPEEDAEAESQTPEDGASVNGDPTFSVQVTDPTEDTMTVTFKRGEQYQLEDENITVSQGVSSTAGVSSQDFDEASGDGFPYQEFTIEVSEEMQDAEAIQVNWTGTSNNEKTFLYAYNVSTQSWDQVEAEAAWDGETLTLTGTVELADYLDGSEVRVMVQNGEGYTPEQYAEGETGTEATSNAEDTPREDYDFTFVVESDTQYYNEDYDGNPSQDVDGDYRYQLEIHEWILANRERMNIQYLFHDGDIIDDANLLPEWENADAAYAMLDEAGLPYGVLAGNHDVDHLEEDYTNYWTYFGEDRYSGNPWYGGSYENNKGHYDLITVDGIDFIMIYMGWGIGDEEIQWMNEVLAQYPERKAILNFHEYLLASSGMGEEAQRIHDEVVEENPNVCMVLSGHYHNAQTLTETFDDDGDGVADRTVYQMLFDYQGLAQGGMGYIRLMHFDTENGTITIRTYSPVLDDYNAKDETGIGDVAGINGEEEFVITFEELGIVSEAKTLETTGLTVNVYGSQVLGTVENVESGATVSYTWTGAPEGTIGWYAEVTDANGGLTRTDVNYLTVTKTGYEPVLTLPDGSANAVEEGASFDPMVGVSAQDYAGNDITDRITVEGEVDTSQPGTYSLTYTVTDEAGNTATAVRTVQVLAADDGGDTGDGGNTGTGDGGNTGTGDSGTGNGGNTGTGDSGTGNGGNTGTGNSGNTGTGGNGNATNDTPKTSDGGSQWMPLYAAGALLGMAGAGTVLRKKRKK